MGPHEAQRRMVELEHHDQQWNGVEFLAWLLGFERDEATGDDVLEVLTAESERAFKLADEHYSTFTMGRRGVAVLNPRMIAQIGFVQGATFAAAALGRQPWPASADPDESWRRLEALRERVADAKTQLAAGDLSDAWAELNAIEADSS